MSGVKLHCTIELYRKMHMAVPAEHHRYLDGLCGFIRLAATAKKNAKESVLEKKWAPYNHKQNETILVWYDQLLDLVASTATGSADAAGPAALKVKFLGDALPDLLQKEMKKCAYIQAKLDQLYYLVDIEPVEVEDRTPNLMPAFWRDFEVAR